MVLLLGVLLIRVEPAEANCPETPLLAEPTFQEDVRPAIDDLYNRQPASGVHQLESWMTRCPNHPIWDLWDAMVLWWEVLEDLDRKSLDNELVNQLELANRRGSAWVVKNPDSPDGWFVQALANGLLARLHANRGRWVRSVWVARDARRASESLEQRLPGLADHQLSRGLTLYYSAWLPDHYKVLRPFRWMMPEGDREQGLKRLASARKNALFVRAEATYFTGLILLRYEGQPDKALVQFRDLASSYPGNKFYERILIQALLETAQSAERNAELFRARKLYREVVDRSEDSRIREQTREVQLVAIRALERIGADIP